MTEDQDSERRKRQIHRLRHVELHRALDELLADYMRHHPEQNRFLETPIGTLLGWSHEQTIDPAEDPHDPQADLSIGTAS
jgi:hypothetical protein